MSEVPLYGRWAEGAVVVATSNRHPKELYKNGIQRDLFVPCINQIQVPLSSQFATHKTVKARLWHI